MKWIQRISLAILIGCSVAALAGDKEHGTVISEVTLYVSPDPSSQKLARVTRGRDVFQLDHTMVDSQPWVQLLATVDVDVERETARQITGWVPAKSVVTTSTPNGGQIIYGEAVDSEKQADMRGGRRHGDDDARRLYYRLYEYFPNSPLAGEALWRNVNIQWQQERADVSKRPSSREMDPGLRPPINDEGAKLVNKKFPHTKWADMASFLLIDNKLCGSWKGETKCPEKESDLYEKYAREHPDSPRAAEALYNAATREGALVEMFKANHEQDKSEKARKKGIDLAQEIVTKYPDGDWKPRAMELMFALQQGIPTYNAEADRSSR